MTFQSLGAEQTESIIFGQCVLIAIGENPAGLGMSSRNTAPPRSRADAAKESLRANTPDGSCAPTKPFTSAACANPQCAVAGSRT